MRGLPSGDPHDPGYRRLRYVRYADDVLLGFAGPKAEAEEIKARLAQFLRDDLKLELAQDKTLITHARSSAARFLGYEITVQHNNRQVTGGQREANGKIWLRVPRSVIKAKCAPYLKRGQPARHDPLVNEADYAIVATFGAKFRGIVQYYLLAGDVHRLSTLRWVMETSMLKTLAGKHHSTVSKMAAKHKTTIQTPHGKRLCFEAVLHRAGRRPLVARFGGIPLKRQIKAVLDDRQPGPTTHVFAYKELIGRLRKDRCELCGHKDNTQVHHVRKLADLTRPGQPQPAWAQVMARRRRKTLVVCRPCHDHIHSGPTVAPLTS